ncbi:MAG: electron transfer flavoprotein subunit beta/FixA family protein [Anaerolineales bacterium]|nr:electron transfer flavoprotein subunit beta/FixA family protein [Anaerolineales bacterium]
MEILVCIKRVPATGAKMILTEDEQAIETRNLGFAISPHEECAVEEGVRLVEAHGGNVTVLTLGAAVAEEQLRDSLAVGAERAILLETDGSEWGPMATAVAIIEAVRTQQQEGVNFDMLLFGNESADSGGYQVGIRVAHALDMPCVTGIKGLEVKGDTAVARREVSGGWEVFEVSLPAVFTVKEGINLPRYPSLPGRRRAKKKTISQFEPQRNSSGMERIRLKTPAEQAGQAEILGEGTAAVAKAVEVLKDLGVI